MEGFNSLIENMKMRYVCNCADNRQMCLQPMSFTYLYALICRKKDLFSINKTVYFLLGIQIMNLFYALKYSL